MKHEWVERPGGYAMRCSICCGYLMLGDNPTADCPGPPETPKKPDLFDRALSVDPWDRIKKQHTEG